MAAASEPLAEALDEAHGASVTAHEIFNAPRKYEAEFIEDCVTLNVKMPDALTRVTEARARRPLRGDDHRQGLAYGPTFRLHGHRQARRRPFLPQA